METPYEMTLDLRVLDHLGIKLYSNAAAVLSEAVANAWDADAENVVIDINPDRVVIDDDGVGMDLERINNRFLYVGYDKRSIEGESSEKHRRFMGRKGIGKLALFSIADVIEVHTRRGDARHAFRMNVNKIRLAMSKRELYRPEPIEFVERERGTRIVLSSLKKRRTASSIPALRKRVARRFSIIGRSDVSGDRFSVILNGEPIGPQDREDLKAVEFLWEFGAQQVDPVKECPVLVSRFVLPGIVDEFRPGWRVSGWLGTVSQPKNLKSDETGSLNGIVVLARGRLIQENILDKLSFSRIVANYLTGQVEADFLDLADYEDIATSDRQRLVEDDERYISLVRFLRTALLAISDQWTELRNEVRGKEAVAENPSLVAWLEMLPQGQRRAAKRLLGLIRGIELDSEEDRSSLYRSGVLAFERLRIREESHRLVEEGDLSAVHLLPLLSDLSTLEGSLYGDIVRSRLDVLRRFEDLVDTNEKEKVLQEHLFENLWLLDPGWERAAGSERIEQALKTEYKDFSPDLSEEESLGRVDIHYRTNAGQHIVIELKRASRRLHLHELVQQGEKYRSALYKCLTSAGFANPQLSIVFVVGESVYEEEAHGGAERVANMLATMNARVVRYETLVRGARDAYSEYLEVHRTATHLMNEVLRHL